MKQEQMKSYFAIIPANVRYDKDLAPNAKLLYGEITALCNEKGFCWATNEYFAELYNVSKISVSNWVNSLVKKGYIKSEIIYKEGTKEILNRYLSLLNEPIKENFNRGIKENFKDNNTYNNNTMNNTINNYNNNNNSEEPKDTLFDLIEQNFMRQLSPMDYEQISLWEDNELTRYAIRETVLKNIYSIKYIDTVLQNYKKKGIKTVEQARQETERIKEQKERRNYTPKKSTTQETLERWRDEIEQVRSERLARKN